MKSLIQRLSRLDNLITHKRTGSPADFAQKIGISERSLYDYLKLLKDMGAPVKFSRHRRTFYYVTDGNFRIGFFWRIILFCRQKIGLSAILISTATRMAGRPCYLLNPIHSF
jgi:hypothetical protein